MISLIQPTLVTRGKNATAISYYTNFDDQATTATWWVGFGNMVPVPAVLDDKKAVVTPATSVYAGIDNQAVNLTMSGDDYKSWDGTQASAFTWICAQLSLLPA